MRKRIFEILERGKPGDRLSISVDWFFMVLITLNVLAVILESFKGLRTSHQVSFRSFEIVSVVIFTGEYLLRILTSDLKYPQKKKILSVLVFIFSGMGMIDLLAILPFYLPLATRIDLRVLRILRLTRVIRIMKIGRYSRSLSLIARVFRRKRSDLIVTIFVTSLLILLASSLMYYIESDTQPEEFPNIVASFWWAIATLTTVGYGDVYPVTVLGKILSGIIAMLGIGLVALPTGIISAGFMEEIQGSCKPEREPVNYCPYCGKELSSE